MAVALAPMRMRKRIRKRIRKLIRSKRRRRNRAEVGHLNYILVF